MQKKVIVEKMKVQSQRLMHLLTEFSLDDNHSVSEIEQILKETEQLARTLSAYRFLAEHKEISNDINVHMKIMDVVSKQEEAKVELKETIKQAEPIVKPVEIIAKQADPSTLRQAQGSGLIGTEKGLKVEANADPEEDEHSEINSSLKKIEFGINDKYRIINELFHQSNAEYTTAINQLNMTDSLEDAENYLDSLKSVYSWKSEHPLVKIVYAATQKRFL